MNYEAQLKLQAFLDGELSVTEAREVADWLARDSDATALLAELRNTRQALASCAPDLKLPEAGEFYWSKIERAIRQSGPASAAAEPPSVFARLQRLLVPASVAATLLVVVTVAALQYGARGRAGQPDTEIMTADAGTFTYHDYANGTTLVWLSFPAESEFANNSVH
jgi:anti-sigma factor RsiW